MVTQTNASYRNSLIPGSIHYNGRDAKTYPKVESLLKSKRFSKRS